jgi:predicted nucleotidyltransferase
MESLLEPSVRERIVEIAASHGAGNLELFGSAARGELRPDSDIDLLLDIVGRRRHVFPAASPLNCKAFWAGLCNW